MADPSDQEIETVLRKLSQEDFTITDQELETLLWITAQDGPDALEKAEFSLRFTLPIERMARSFHRCIWVESRRNPVFNARLLPLFDDYEASLLSSRMVLFCRVCKTLLEDSPMCMERQEPPDDYTGQQLVFVFDDLGF